MCRDKAGRGARVFGRLHAPGLRRGVEQRGADLGLPVPRVAVLGRRDGDQRTGGERPAARAGDDALDNQSTPNVQRPKVQDAGLGSWAVGL